MLINNISEIKSFNKSEDAEKFITGLNPNDKQIESISSELKINISNHSSKGTTEKIKNISKEIVAGNIIILVDRASSSPPGNENVILSGDSPGNRQVPLAPPTDNDNPTQMEAVEVECFKQGDALKDTYKDNPEELNEEFDRQLANQEKGLNNLTIDEYKENRLKYKEIGRGDGKAQRKARSKLSRQMKKSIKKQLRKENKDLTRQEINEIAQSRTKEKMSTLAALHNPDMIAGGNDIINDDFGNSSVNSSFGSQWKDRVDQLDIDNEKALKVHGPDAKMNVKLKRC